MTIDEDILAFHKWANSLGCPSEKVPTDEALKSLLKSPQGMMILGLMAKAKPKQEVERIQKNILVTKMKNIQNEIIPLARRKFLPKEMQRFLNISDLQKKKSEILNRIEDRKSQYEKLMAYVKEKNIKRNQLKNNYETLLMKINLLKLKTDSLMEQINKEDDDRQKINSIMPVKMKLSNSNESLALKAITECLQELNNFYEIFFNSSNGYQIQDAKDDLWKKLRNILTNVPNYPLWNVILKMKDEQLQNISDLNNKRTSVEAETAEVATENMSPLKKEIMKAQVELISIFVKCAASNEEYNRLNKTFLMAYEKFGYALKFKMNLFDGDASKTDVDNDIANYASQFATYNFGRAQIECLRNEIDRLKSHIGKNNATLKDHQMVLHTTQQMYGDIETNVNRMQQELSQLNQIKEKIAYSKNLLHYMLQDIQMNQQQMPIRRGKFSTSGDSFEFTENVLCSTKLDFDVSTIACNATRMDMSVVNSINAGNSGTYFNGLPQHVTELEVFLQMEIQKFRLTLFKDWTYLGCNYLQLSSDLEAISPILTYGHLLSPDGFNIEIFKKILWYKQIRNQATELKTNAVLTEVDEIKLKAQRVAQHEQIAELLDQINIIGINTNRILKKCSKYYRFILENTLKYFIPTTKLFNNRNYEDYEAEYARFYRIAVNGPTIK